MKQDNHESLTQTQKTEEAVARLVIPVLEGLGLELFAVQFRRERTGWVLRLIIDKEGTVSIDDCTAVSREMGDLLDVDDPIHHPYHLEVSSPGLDRPLRNEADYLRFAGRKVRIKTAEPIGKQQVFKGTIVGIREGNVLLSTNKEGEVVIPLSLVAKANLEIEF